MFRHPQVGIYKGKEVQKILKEMSVCTIKIKYC